MIWPLRASIFILDFLPACVNAFDLPDAVVELDLLDLDDALGEGDPADVLDGHGLGPGGGGKPEAESEESRDRTH